MSASSGRYRVRIARSAQAEMDRLSQQVHRRVAARILELEAQPRPPGCRKLRGSDGWRLRVGDWRVLYVVDDAARLVTVMGVRHRSVAYRG
ncbi:MAG: type II toxin-antitoxin system RelE/ParE family toxin [Deltaproteobacteria bacterium]|nr:type II toxin-antitoxin system RelE/ParE family toxin [Deltaproteobacteria bacterium]